MKLERSKSKSLYLFILILIGNYGAYCQSRISGNDRVQYGSLTNYSIQIIAESVQWRLIPEASGLISYEKDPSRVTVQWNNNKFNYKDGVRCVLIAEVTFPNSDHPAVFTKEIRLQNSTEKGQIIRRPVNNTFTGTTKDSLRFFCRVLCDTSLGKRTVILRDSSFFSKTSASTDWYIKNGRSKIIYTGKGQQIKVSLTAGHYSITMKKVDSGSLYTLTDTLTIYPVIKPSHTVSTQLPCAKSVVEFINTSQPQDLILGSTFHFGNGETADICFPEKSNRYRYNGEGMQLVLMTMLESKDMHGCIYKSEEIPIQVQQNLFSLTNVRIEPNRSELKSETDSVLLKCVQGNNLSPANPNGPFRFLWNTGDTAETISTKYAGRYTVQVTDKFGCKSERVNPAIVTREYHSSRKIIVSGPREVKAGDKMEFKMDGCRGCLYQWRIIYNGAALTTEPSVDNTMVPDGWEKAKAGELRVIGIELKKKGSGYQSEYSDTLRVRIVE